jgi:hypothetical protein
MELLTKSWHSAEDRFGNVAVIGFLLVQYLDGVYTYLGFSIWGVNIEANPLIRSAVGAVGPGTGLALAKLVAIGFGMMLHLRRVHRIVVLLTAVYVILSIVPWTALLFLS